MQEKKTVIVRIVLKGNPDKVPEFGLGKGVIKEAIVDIDESNTREVIGLSQLIDDLIDESVGYTIEPYNTDTSN